MPIANPFERLKTYEGIERFNLFEGFKKNTSYLNQTALINVLEISTSKT